MCFLDFSRGGRGMTGSNNRSDHTVMSLQMFYLVTVCQKYGDIANYDHIGGH